MSKLKNSKNFYIQIANIAADTARKRMESYSPSLIQIKKPIKPKKGQDLRSDEEELVQDQRSSYTRQTSTDFHSQKQSPHKFKSTFVTAAPSSMDRSFASTFKNRSQIDPKLTDTNNSVSPRSVYGYLKVNFVDNVIPPTLMDPSIVSRKQKVKLEKEQQRVEGEVRYDNLNYTKAQSLLEPIKDSKLRRPSYKYEEMLRRYKEMQQKHGKTSRKQTRMNQRKLVFRSHDFSSKHTPIPQNKSILNRRDKQMVDSIY